MVMSIDDPLRLVVPARQPARHEGRRQAAAARGGPAARRSCRRSPASLNREIVAARAEGQDRVAGPAGDDRRAAAVLPAPAAQGHPGGTRREGGGRDRANCGSGSRRRTCPSTWPTAATREVERLERMTPASPEYQMIRTYLDWVLEVPWTHDHRGPPRPGRGPPRARRGPLRPRQGEGADRRVPGRAQAEGRHEGADPLLRRRRPASARRRSASRSPAR